jgi:hypothetical protein
VPQADVADQVQLDTLWRVSRQAGTQQGSMPRVGTASCCGTTCCREGTVLLVPRHHSQESSAHQQTGVHTWTLTSVLYVESGGLLSLNRDQP